VLCRKWIGTNRCDIEQLPAAQNQLRDADTFDLAPDGRERDIPELAVAASVPGSVDSRMTKAQSLVGNGSADCSSFTIEKPP
jgi:hypothetical protein